jgi:hypothetical protein
MTELSLYSYLSEPPEDFERKKQRALSQPIAILSRDREGLSEMFEMSGSGGSRYTVEIDQVLSCTCPDFKFRKQSCKHIIYVSFYQQ